MPGSMSKPVVEVLKIDELTPDANNANRGTQRGRGMLEASFEECGAGRSLVLDKHGNVIAGNKSLEVAADMGFKNVIVVKTKGDELVAVQREDLDLVDDDRAKRLALYDNRVSEVDLVWDDAFLAANEDLLEGIFSPKEIEHLIEDAGKSTDLSDEVDLAKFEDPKGADVAYRVIVDSLTYDDAQLLLERLKDDFEQARLDQYRAS